MRPSSCCFWSTLLLLVGVCAAQGTADCNAAIVTLLPCLDYVQGNVSAPSASCCTGLASVVQSNPSCLCVLANDSALPIAVDAARATQLPVVCNVTSPTSINCTGAVTPVAEPVPSPPVTSPPAAPVVAPAAVPVVAPATGTPPPMVTTPVMAPSVVTTPAVTPSAPPSTTPASTPPMAAPPTPALAPAVSPTLSPASTPATTPSTTPVGTPALAPSSLSPLPFLSSPPAPPPAAEDQNHGAAIAASLLVSVFAVALSSILFLQF